MSWIEHLNKIVRANVTLRAVRTKCVVCLVRAYVGNNRVPAGELGHMITAIHLAVEAVSSGSDLRPALNAARRHQPTPAEIQASIRPNGLVSFENGKLYQVLRRHLRALGLTPGEYQYRTKWGVPEDYPMVTTVHSKHRAILSRFTQANQRLRVTSGASA